ncbi:HET-domain-containing protein [Xylariaceae sp. AK1471]|nr:HET-domain-containing protein [Xylariaceae sp. AK1471]
MIGLKYAILSHVWGEKEIIFEDIAYGTEQSKPEASRHKVYKACERAAKDDYQYIWIDTCCIDKRSSAELSEAINSMFAWYRDAATCYAYLSDAPDDLGTEEGKARFSGSKWFRRGWTLQELLAPKEVEFFSGNWSRIGEKRALSVLLAEITGIDIEILLDDRPLDSASVARRMSWAAKREVTRPEDMAYSLMGIFSVNMPLLYGEGGERAFLRLQEEIMRESDDQSLFAWVDQYSPPNARFGLLAPSPSNFLYSNSIIPYQDWEPRSPYAMTNRGLRIELHLTALNDGQYVAAVDCPAPPNFENSSFLAIYLEKLSDWDGQYTRVRVGTFAMVRQRGPLQSIYIRQKPQKPSDNGAFPQHIMQLRNIPSPSVYKVMHILAPPHTGNKTVPISVRTDTKSLVPVESPLTFPVLRGADQLAAGIIFERDDGERIVVLVGSLKNFQVGFDARELDVDTDPKSIKFEDMQQLYKPSMSGRIELEYHSVRLSATSVFKPPSKYYMIDVGIENVKRSLRLSERLLGVYDVATGSDMRGAISGMPQRLSERAPGNLPVKGITGWKAVL